MEQLETLKTMIEGDLSALKYQMELQRKESTEIYSAVLALANYYIPSFSKVRQQLYQAMSYYDDATIRVNKFMEELSQTIESKLITYQDRLTEHKQRVDEIEEKFPETIRNIHRLSSNFKVESLEKKLESIKTIIVEIKDTDKRTQTSIKTLIDDINTILKDEQ